MHMSFAPIRRCLDCRAVVRLGHHAEHYLLVGYAAIEAVGRVSLIWYFSVGLVVTGVLGLVYDVISDEASH
jgi:hypothetical protein